MTCHRRAARRCRRGACVSGARSRERVGCGRLCDRGALMRCACGGVPSSASTSRARASSAAGARRRANGAVGAASAPQNQGRARRRRRTRFSGRAAYTSASSSDHVSPSGVAHGSPRGASPAAGGGPSAGIVGNAARARARQPRRNAGHGAGARCGQGRYARAGRTRGPFAAAADMSRGAAPARRAFTLAYRTSARVRRVMLLAFMPGGLYCVVWFWELRRRQLNVLLLFIFILVA